MAFHYVQAVAFTSDGSGKFQSTPCPGNGMQISSPSLLLANVGVLFCISLGIVVLCRELFSFVRRPHVTLQGLLLVTVVVALFLGMWGHCIYRRMEEARIAAALRDIGWEISEKYGAALPQCVVVLFAEAGVDLPDSTYRIDGISWERDCEASREIRSPEGVWNDVNVMLRDVQPLLARLPYCRHVVVQDAGLNDEGTAALCEALPYCTSADFATKSEMSDHTIEAVARAWPDMEWLLLENGHFTDVGAEHICRLTELRTLVITGGDHEMSEHAWLRILNLPSLSVLQCPTECEMLPSVRALAHEREIECGAGILGGSCEWRPSRPLSQSDDEEAGPGDTSPF